jgi:PAS domain S-box-containing protein
MNFFSRFPILVWFMVIALITSVGVSYYTYAMVFQKQIEDVKKSELRRVTQRMVQLQGTVNDFNLRRDFNAIHREVSRISSDPTMELIAIVDEHGVIRYSSSIEYRDVSVKALPALQQLVEDRDDANYLGSMDIDHNAATILGLYPLDDITHEPAAGDYVNAYLYSRHSMQHTLNELYYRQQQEIIQITLIHFGILLAGFLLLYFSMRHRIKSIIKGINAFSNGNYDARIQLPGADEFSKISTGFDIMAGRLQNQNRNLTDLTEQLRDQHHELAQQEEDLRVTLDSIGDAVIATDASGLVTRMNPVAQNITGWQLHEAIGKPITDIFNIINAETKQAIENPIDKVIKTGKTVFLSNNTTLISRDGNQYHISDSAAPIRNQENKILGMVLIFNDVTEKYRLRQSAAQSERLLRSIMDNSPAIIYVKDRQGQFSYVNQQFLRSFNMTPEDIIGKNLHDVFSQEVADTARKNDLAVFASGSVLEAEETAQQDNGLHTYASTRFPLTDEAGNIYAVCGISIDITDRKQHEETLRRTQKMDALGKLTGGIAHDFNNMLGVILGYSELIQDSLAEDDRLRKYINEIHHAGERGASLTRKLLSFSRPQQSENDRLNINELLLDRQDMLEKVLTVRIHLQYRLQEDLWPVWINAGDLEDAIVNISINAMHAMENKGELIIATENISVARGSREFAQAAPGEYVMISFTDTGTGMSKEVQEKIFDPFFTSKGNLGAGLGLSQVYGLVQTNGGFIDVDSAPGEGTRITLYLPRLHADGFDVASPDNENLARHRGNASILVVDDEASLREMTAEILMQSGYQVHTAANGRDALELLKTQSVDILFSDIIMPEMDGHELARQVQQQFPCIKIQLVSGYSQEGGAMREQDELYEKLLHKPFNSDDVLRCIKELMKPDS